MVITPTLIKFEQSNRTRTPEETGRHRWYADAEGNTTLKKEQSLLCTDREWGEYKRRGTTANELEKHENKKIKNKKRANGGGIDG